MAQSGVKALTFAETVSRIGAFATGVFLLCGSVILGWVALTITKDAPVDIELKTALAGEVALFAALGLLAIAKSLGASRVIQDVLSLIAWFPAFAFFGSLVWWIAVQ